MVKEAIKNFGNYSLKQYDVISALIDISVNQTISIKVDVLCEITHLKRSTVYFALKAFQKDELIIKDKKKHSLYKFNQERLDDLIKMQIKIESLKGKSPTKLL